MPIKKIPSTTDKPVQEQTYSFTPPKFTLQDLIVPKNTLNNIKDFLAYETNSDLVFNAWGLSETHSHQKQIAINLYGQPGTGKTMAAHAIANALNKPLIAVNYSEIESKYVGETSKNLTSLFQTAEKLGAIIFFDEADAILSKRVTNMSNSTDVSVNQTRSVLLTLMNNHKGLIIFTTNFIENYDPAFMRRILSHILFELPDIDNRKLLWQKYIPSRLPHDANIDYLAEISENLSGSDISNCVLKAALSAAQAKSLLVLNKFFEQAIEEIKLSKIANSNIKTSDGKTTVETNIVDENYVKQQFNPQSL